MMTSSETLSGKYLSAWMKKPIRIYLLSGIQLRGRLVGYDEEFLVLDRGDSELQWIRLGSITTLQYIEA